MKLKVRSMTLGVVLIILSALISYSIWLHIARNQVERAAAEFVRDLLKSDYQAARLKSCGNLAFRLSGMKPAASAKLTHMQIKVLQFSRHWAMVQIDLETVDAAGRVDVGWYELTLVGQPWRVLQIKAIIPQFYGITYFQNSSDNEEVKKVFRAFLRAVNAGNDQKPFLIGPARTEYKKSLSYLNQGVKIGHVTGLKMRPLYRSGKTNIVEFQYDIQKRHVKVAASFYKTMQGWKIVQINNV